MACGLGGIAQTEMTGRHPIAVSELLQLRSAVRRGGWRIVACLATVLIVMALVFGAYAAECRQAAAVAGRWVDRYALLLSALVAVNAAILVSRSRWRHKHSQQSSWLAAAPIEAASVQRWILLRVLITSLGALAAIEALLFVIGVLAGADVRISHAAGLIGGAFVAGCIPGWFARQGRMPAHAGSRYVPRHGRVIPAGAFSRWPIAQALAWHRPENSRFVLAAALLAVQGGSTIAVGLGVVGFWLLGTYLVVLLHSTFVVGREAASWLQSTPMSFARFAWPLARRMFVHQAVGSLAASGIGLLLGASPVMLAYLAVLWMTLIGTTTAVSLADSYHRRHPPFKWTLLAAVAALAELRQRGTGIVFALLVAGAHVVQALRSVRGLHDRRA